MKASCKMTKMINPNMNFGNFMTEISVVGNENIMTPIGVVEIMKKKKFENTAIEQAILKLDELKPFVDKMSKVESLVVFPNEAVAVKEPPATCAARLIMVFKVPSADSKYWKFWNDDGTANVELMATDCSEFRISRENRAVEAPTFTISGVPSIGTIEQQKLITSGKLYLLDTIFALKTIIHVGNDKHARLPSQRAGQRDLSMSLNPKSRVVVVLDIMSLDYVANKIGEVAQKKNITVPKLADDEEDGGGNGGGENSSFVSRMFNFMKR